MTTDLSTGDFLISVIVPVYNVEAYLPRCLDSIASQTYSNIEVILVDDGSTDRSGEVCDNYCLLDSRFKAIHQENRWLAEARNTGLDACHGEFVFFIDSDDSMHIETLARLLRAIKENPGCDLAIGGYREVDADFNELDYPLPATPDVKTWAADKILSSMAAFDEWHMLLGTAWNILIPRNLISGNRFPSFWGNEDFPFNFRVYNKIRAAAVLDEPLYCYTISRSGGIMSQANTGGGKYYYLKLLAFYSNYRDLPDNLPGVKAAYLERLYKLLIFAAFYVTDPSIKGELDKKRKGVVEETAQAFLHSSGIPVYRRMFLWFLFRCPRVSSLGLRMLGN